MIIDGHSHVTLPVEEHVKLMDKTGVDKTVLFSTTVHPEEAKNLEGVKDELKTLNAIISGKKTAILDAKYKSMCELRDVIRKYPSRYIGFGSVPVGMSKDDTDSYIEKNVIKNGFVGLGEFTIPSGQVRLLDTIFKSSMEFGKLPIWIHAFNPLVLQDIKEIAELSRKFPEVPVILGHMGGSNWMSAIDIAKEIPNFYLDTSAYFSTLVLKTAINELPLKCIFGVDMPYGDLELSKEAIQKLSNGKDVSDAVLGGNMAKLLKF